MQKRIKLLKNQKGMTLVELLAVLVILGIIAAIAVPMIGNVINNSKERAVLSDAASIIAAAQLAYANDEADQDNIDTTLTYKYDTLNKYVDGITLADGDEVVRDANNKWKVKYSKLTALKTNSKYSGKFDGDYMTSSNLNSLLKKD